MGIYLSKYLQYIENKISNSILQFKCQTWARRFARRRQLEQPLPPLLLVRVMRIRESLNFRRPRKASVSMSWAAANKTHPSIFRVSSPAASPTGREIWNEATSSSLSTASYALFTIFIARFSGNYYVLFVECRGREPRESCRALESGERYSIRSNVTSNPSNMNLLFAYEFEFVNQAPWNWWCASRRMCSMRSRRASTSTARAEARSHRKSTNDVQHCCFLLARSFNAAHRLNQLS